MNKSIYGLCSASASFHEHCAKVLYEISFKPSHADPNLWMKDCKTHYKYVAKVGRRYPRHVQGTS